MSEQFDPKSYSPGDPLYVRVNDGWRDFSAKRYLVEKVTPSGQVVVRDGIQEVRFNSRGKRIGSSEYNSNVISETTAEKYLEGARVRRLWREISQAAINVDDAARGTDAAALVKAMEGLQTTVSLLPTPQEPPHAD